MPRKKTPRKAASPGPRDWAQEYHTKTDRRRLQAHWDQQYANQILQPTNAMWVDRTTRQLIELMSEADLRWEALLAHQDPSTLTKYRSTRKWVISRSQEEAHS